MFMYNSTTTQRTSVMWAIKLNTHKGLIAIDPKITFAEKTAVNMDEGTKSVPKYAQETLHSMLAEWKQVSSLTVRVLSTEQKIEF